MKTCIIAGGMIEDDFASSFLKKEQFDCILAADKGLAFLARAGILPTEIMGDFDSLPEGILDLYKEKGQIPIHTFNPVKDNTDMDIALQRAYELGTTELVLLGATGGRLDHFLSTWQNMKTAWQKGIQASIVDRRNRITLPVKKHFTITKAEQFGKYVSFVPLEDQVKGLTLVGFKYPLAPTDLVNNSGGLCISNELAEEVGEISYEDGILVMIESRD